jgi:hypothetical protein
MGMAENLKAMMEADVAATVSDVSAVLTYKRHATTGTVSPIGAGDNVDADGILQTADAEFVALKSGFRDVPPVRSVVDVDGVKFFVESLTDDLAAITLRLKRGPA